MNLIMHIGRRSRAVQSSGEYCCDFQFIINYELALCIVCRLLDMHAQQARFIRNLICVCLYVSLTALYVPQGNQINIISIMNIYSSSLIVTIQLCLS